jgi:hypothetical protein
MMVRMNLKLYLQKNIYEMGDSKKQFMLSTNALTISMIKEIFSWVNK